MKAYTVGQKRKAKRGKLPELAATTTTKKKSGARNRAEKREREDDVPTLKARARQMGKDESKPEVIAEMRSQAISDAAGRALTLSMGEGSAKPLIASYGSLRASYERNARAMGIAPYPKSGKIEMMPDRMETSADAPPVDMRSEEERDIAALRKWDEWRGHLDAIGLAHSSAIFTALHGFTDLHRVVYDKGVARADVTPAGQRFVEAMKALHARC